MTSLIDQEPIEEIRRIERATGRSDVFAGFIGKLEAMLKGFAPGFADCVARGDGAGALRLAHTLKGTTRQLGAKALGELFAEIEAMAKAGDYPGAKQRFEAAAGLVTQSLEALKRA
ncbi:MAG TPA: Hpt domain-containing protein [Burkholderiales bacterium]|jgi:HPt (histidine-containing phosphotransfer) domain-containing protein